MESKQITKLAGALIFIGIIVGILSVTPSVESENYLEILYINKTKVLIAALFQFLLVPVYIGFSLLLYPLIKQNNRVLSIGFVGFRFMAGAFQLLGIILLPALIFLSEKYSMGNSSNFIFFETVGEILKIFRDLINHLGVIVATGLGNLLLYSILYKEKNIPIWLSIWGLVGNVVIIVGSFLILFQLIDIISIEYIVMTIPLLLQEVVLAFWLIKNGFRYTKILI